MASTTRATLLERLRDADDVMAWEEFFQAYAAPLYAYARHRGCDDATAEEMVQEVMLAVFENRDVFRYNREQGRFRDWLGTVLRHKLAAHCRRPGERVRACGAENVLREVAADEAPGDEVWAAVFERALLAAILDVVRRESNPRTYQAFELVELEGLSGAEAARLTGLSRNAVYLARQRVLRRLEELGASYRRDGVLSTELKQAVELRLAGAVERSLSGRIERSMAQRWERDP